MSSQTAPASGASFDFDLGIAGWKYSHLWDDARLRDLADAFLHEVRTTDGTTHAQWLTHVQKVQLGHHSPLGPVEESELLIKMSGHLSRFLAKLFRVEAEVAALRGRVEADKPIWRMKQDFLVRRAFKKGAGARASATDFPALDAEASKLFAAGWPEKKGGADAERSVAEVIVALLDAEKLLAKKAKDAAAPGLEKDLAARVGKIAALFPEAADDGARVRAALDLLERWSFARSLHPEGKKQIHEWASYRFPRALDYENLVDLERPDAAIPETTEGPHDHRRRRDGFKLTDRRASFREVEGEVEYCLYCHEREKDSCSKGFPEKAKGASPLLEGEAAYKQNPLGIPLTGCPLDERISEAHVLKSKGDSLAALAIITIDNPMAPGTGHRICNDCMKSCVFQKQEPVNIPQAETGILTDVLNLPWGVEIYQLLTRWNPLHAQRPWPRAYTGKNVLVVGLGPAGYTLAHYLLNEGFGVVGIDGLKIEPLPAELVGAGAAFPKPVKYFSEIYRELDARVLSGFGGVSEYGITVRWDKNFLNLLQLTISRRKHFKAYGGVRFGGTMTVEDAWKLGFDHVAIAAGAGRPTIISMKNNLIRGIRKASDFLMALQLTGAFKRTAMANLQVQLPAVVIGGGLTAIDTGTELAAYYPVQVEKVLERYEVLSREMGEEKFWDLYPDRAENSIMKEFIEHGREVRAERARAKAAGEEPDFQKLVRQWGGVHIAYRKGLVDAPAYRLNHEEVVKAFEEGVRFVEKMSPVEAVPDGFGAVSAIVFERQALKDGKWRGTGEQVTLPAKTVCVAAGTSPNITYERELSGTFELDDHKEYFRAYQATLDDAGN
ncbi:MAG TPA: FAD-dependent oxidoreductase, partial [bacterium]|nr:FAD-dependent oxidoreductase [bacterium]